MLPASKAPFPWLIVFFRKIESGFIWERGGVGKKASTDEPTRKPVGTKGWVGYALLKHALPAEHLTIECRMVEQKKEPPSTRRTAVDGGKGHRTGMAPCPGDNLAQAECFLSIRKTTIFKVNWLVQRGESRLWITSLNSHLIIILFGTIYGFLSKISFLQIIPDLSSRPTSLLASFSMLHAPCQLSSRWAGFFPCPSPCAVLSNTHISV